MQRPLFVVVSGVVLWFLVPQETLAQWYAGSQSYALNVDKYDSRYGEAKPVRWSHEVPPLRPPWWTLHVPFRWLKGLAHPDPYHVRAPEDRRHVHRPCRHCVVPSLSEWDPVPEPAITRFGPPAAWRWHAFPAQIR